MAGIYIPGMEMPVGGCVNCIFCVYDRCFINLKLEKKASVTHGCPLVPVPDHGRLIDANTAARLISRLRDRCGNDDMAFALNWAIGIVQDLFPIIQADREAET